MSQKMHSDSGTIFSRGLKVFNTLFILFLCLFIMLFYRMVIKSSEYKNRAVAQWTNDVKIDAKRGNILDRNGIVELAISIDVYRIDLDLNYLKKYSKDKKISLEQIAKEFADILELDENDLLKEISKNTLSVTIKRRIEKKFADSIRNLNYPFVIISPDTQRYYPNGDFLSQVIGATDIDGKGQSGIEAEYDKDLAGTRGLRVTEVDKFENDLPYVISEFTKPIPGKDITLTIDENVQYFAEKAAQEALTDNNAKATTVIVMDPKTGEILAMANKESFDLNAPRNNLSNEELQKQWRNRAVSDAYEQGSIFKIFTLAAAFEENLVSENDSFVCTGETVVQGITLHCWNTKGHGTQNLRQILENSCNIGFIEIGKRLGASKLSEYIEKMGFGKITGIDLQGEARGIVKAADKITQLDLATISFGQVNALTPIQYMQAFNAVANGGKLITPHLMKEISYLNDNNQRIVEKTYEQAYPESTNKQVLSPETCEKLRDYLESVVSEGGGKKAFIPGYRIAGKTGTAQKIDPASGRYGEGMYLSTFVGMAPSNDPKFTVLVSIDEPRGDMYYAGQIAAPVGQKVFNDLFNYYSINVDASEEEINENLKRDVVVPNVVGLTKEEASKMLDEHILSYDIRGDGDTIRDMSPKPGALIKEGKKIILLTDSSDNYNKEIIVPDLRGYSKERAYELLTNLGFKVVFKGSGLVSSQSIDPNVTVLKGENIEISLAEIVGD